MTVKKPEKEESDISRNTSVIDLQATNSSSTVKLTEYDKDSKPNGVLKDGEYNPFSNREKTHVTTDTGAFIHMFKASLGSGILAVPRAFRNSGLVVGIIGTILVGVICTHCVAMLVRCSRVLSARVKRPSLGFAETTEVAFKTGPEGTRKFASLAREFVTMALFATYYFGSTVYIVIIALSLQQVINYHFELGADVRVYILLLTIPLIPLGIWRQLKFLVPVSAAGSLFILLGLLATFYYSLTDIPPISSRKFANNLEQLPLFFSTVLFAMEGVGTVLPIENSMEHPEHFLGTFGVLNVSMSFVVLLYTSLGFFGYLKYGEEVQGSITLNLPEDAFSETVKLLVALSILFTYGLQFCVPSEIVWTRLKPYVAAKHENLCYYTMRTLMIIGSVCIAILVPNLAPFIALVGSICFSILGLWIPAMTEVMTYWEEDVSCWLYVKNSIIMLLSLCALVTGAYTSLLDILEMYRTG